MFNQIIIGMKRLFILFFFLSIFIQSCALSTYTYGLDKKIRGLELGMDKSSIITLLGPNYKLASAIVLDAETREEVFQYEGDSNGVYDLVLRNGKLVEWFFTKSEPKREAEVTVINKSDN